MHLNSEAIFDLIEGRSENRHAEECSECQLRLGEWKQWHSRLFQSRLESAPADVLNAAYRIIEAGSTNTTGKAKLGKIAAAFASEVIASIVFDSHTQSAFAGARGAAESRQMVLRAAEFDVHVKISGKLESRQVTGQILSRGETGFVETATVHLLHNGSRIQSATLDPLGEFEFDGLPEGSEGVLSLQIDLPNLTVIGALGNGEVA
jgi:hypothetical protein